MARKQFLKRYILDSNGFILNEEGDMLQTYESKFGFFSIVEGKHYYFYTIIDGYERPNFRYIKQMKKTGEWKTYISSNAVKVEGNKLLKTEYEAALHANILIGKYGLDRIPNAVPKPNDTLQYTKHKAFYNVFLNGSSKLTYLSDEIKESIDYLVSHPELKDSLRFLVGDNPRGADKLFQQYLYELAPDCEQVVVCHMDEKPRNNYDFQTYEVEVPENTPYTTPEEYQRFKDIFMNKMCHEAITVTKGNSNEKAH